jgi:hypothetical protein
MGVRDHEASLSVMDVTSSAKYYFITLCVNLERGLGRFRLVWQTRSLYFNTKTMRQIFGNLFVLRLVVVDFFRKVRVKDNPHLKAARNSPS